MPRLVDYSARFEFLRPAAFVLVRDEGPHALSRNTLAAVLGTSSTTVRRLVASESDLRSLAADEVTRRRRHGRWGVPRDLDARGRALHLLRRLLADEEHRVAEELAWLRLEVDSRRLTVPDEETREAVRAAYRLADLGMPEDGPESSGNGQKATDPVATSWTTTAASARRT